jgi:hypothetical protein
MRAFHRRAYSSLEFPVPGSAVLSMAMRGSGSRFFPHLQVELQGGPGLKYAVERQQMKSLQERVRSPMFLILRSTSRPCSASAILLLLKHVKETDRASKKANKTGTFFTHINIPERGA